MLPTMAANSPDTYTVAEAAKVLSRTPKRVRQMIGEGKLHPIEGGDVARLPMAQVHALRDQLRTPSTPGPKAATTGLTIADVMALVDQLTTKALEANAEDRARLEAARTQADELMRESFAQERQRADALEAEVKALRAQLEAPQPSGKWWKR